MKSQLKWPASLAIGFLVVMCARMFVRGTVFQKRTNNPDLILTQSGPAGVIINGKKSRRMFSADSSKTRPWKGLATKGLNETWSSGRELPKYFQYGIRIHSEGGKTPDLQQPSFVFAKRLNCLNQLFTKEPLIKTYFGQDLLGVLVHGVKSPLLNLH